MLQDDALNRLQEIVEEPDLQDTRYRLLRKLASGGMATVYLVYDSILHREAALKVLSIPDSNGDLVARLQREALIVARLEHPGIVPIHDVGTLPDGRPYYVMKYVHGERLDEHLQRLNSISDKLRLLERICEPVAFAHAQGVIHRDLKPENIMVGPFGEVLVMDWGLAKALHGTIPDRSTASTTGAIPGQTDHGTVLGTPAYMSPEQSSGDIENVKEQSDVFALGGILYFLLTAQKPGKLTPRQVDSRIPKPVEAIALKALSPAQILRYSGILDMSKDLKRYLDGEPVSAYPENFLETAGRWLSRNYFLVILILTYLIVRTLLLVFRSV